MLLVWILIGVTLGISFQAFNNQRLFDRMKFSITAVVHGREYHRIFTSAFVHVDWMHLGFNLLVLFFFGDSAMRLFGVLGFLTIYFGANGIGKLLTMYLHRNNMEYTSAGASAAINGLIFALVVAAPSMGIGLFLIPLSIPAWIFGILYIAFSMYGFKRGGDNVNHASHLGGALGGVLTALLLQPTLLVENWWVVLLVIVPIGAFLGLAAVKPEFLYVDNFFRKQVDQKREVRQQKVRMSQAEELDMLLEKVNRSGLKSLTPPERHRLEELSRNI